MMYVLATANKGKISELKTILSKQGIDILTRDELGIDVEIEETGSTFLENATIKAKAICELSGLPAIADDSGLMVDALGGAPGVYSSSYGGELLNDYERGFFLLENMKNVEQRSAKFVCNIVCAYPDGTILSAQGECLGSIAYSQDGKNGFGFDSVFIPKDMSMTLANLSQDEKNALSHRGAALRLFCEKIKSKQPPSSMKNRKVGIFGGTFNPPHIGHLLSTMAAASQIDLDYVIIIPTGIPPHKEMPDGTPASHMRFEMVKRTFRDSPKTIVSKVELEQSGRSYTISTIATIKKWYPDAQLYLLTGTDMFLSLDTWKDSEKLLESVIPVAFARNDDDVEQVEAYAQHLKSSYGVHTETVSNSVISISSSQLREMLPNREGLRYITDTTYDYIIGNRLYGAKPEWDWLRKKAYSMLSASRIAHVAGCESEAISLAKRWDADIDDAREAAILHDITKSCSREEHIKIMTNFGITADDIGYDEEKLFHSKSGALLAKALFGVSDEVANAIMWHTTGKAKMTILEKIVYLADYIELERDFPGIDKMRALAYEDIDAAMIMGLELSISDLERRGITPNRASFDAIEDIRG